MDRIIMEQMLNDQIIPWKFQTFILSWSQENHVSDRYTNRHLELQFSYMEKLNHTNESFVWSVGIAELQHQKYFW